MLGTTETCLDTATKLKRMNVFAHEVIDTWFEDTVKRHCKGRVALFRYADDAVISGQYASDAMRIRTALRKRLSKYHLQLNEEKTHRVRFSKQEKRGGEKVGTFDFLGFTFYLGRTRRGAVIPKLKTSGKRLRSKLKRVDEWAERVRNVLPLKQLWALFRAKLRGQILWSIIQHQGSEHVRLSGDPDPVSPPQSSQPA